MNILSLFSGIGGLELGLERAGMTVVGQVELDPFCRSVLAKHWKVDQHDDVRTAPEWWTAKHRPPVDVVAGGFPCQPFSTAGLRLGTDDPRWGWPWMRDVVRAVRPRYVVVENVAGLLRDRDAFGWLLADLADLGFDAEWGMLPACALGAPHVRERLFLVAYADGEHGPLGMGAWPWQPLRGGDRGEGTWPDRVNGLVAASRRSRRVAHGVPDRLEPSRVRALGNAVVPDVGEYLGRLIVAREQRRP